MQKNSFQQRLQRRKQLIGLLRSSDHWITTDLCAHLEVSHRTLMRDLAELRNEGYPIESDRGRGGGIRLSGRWGIDKLNLHYREVIEMIIALAVVENLQSPLFSTQLKSIRQKISSVFPQAQRRLINAVRKRILVGETASDCVVETYLPPKNNIAEVVSSSFFEKRNMQINYRAEGGDVSRRIIEPHYILLNWPVWYVLAWDHLREDIRLFRLDRIQKCILTEQKFVLKKQQDFQSLYKSYFHSL